MENSDQINQPLTANIQTFITHLPKAELHVHLEGCLTPSLAQTLATRNNISLPESITKSSSDATGYAFHDLTSFLSIYYPAMTVLQTQQDFHDLAWDYLTRADAENIRHVELFFDPQAHTTRSIPFSTIIEGYHSAVKRARSELKNTTSAKLIMCFLRDHSAESAMETLQASLPYKDMIVGVGLDSDERDNPIINVDRIDHGINILASPDLITLLQQKSRTKPSPIGLTTCPISNSIVRPSSKSAEILTLLRRGVKVTVNSDDPGYFRGYLVENMLTVLQGADAKLSELVDMQRNAFEISWISEDERNGFLRELEEYVSREAKDLVM